MFNGPIPGQSLTTEPRAMPYERPPEIADPIEALDLHIENMSRPEAMEEALFFLEMGVDLQTLVEGILRSAVMAGKHSIDISILAGPVLHEFIRGTAVASGIDFEEGIEDKEGKKIQTYARNKMRSARMLSKMGYDEPVEVQEEPSTIEEPMAEEPAVMPEGEPAGLMSRRVM